MHTCKKEVSEKNLDKRTNFQRVLKKFTFSIKIYNVFLIPGCYIVMQIYSCSKRYSREIIKRNLFILQRHKNM